jgi:hypothetical protein
MEPVVALNVNEAGTPATLQTTVVDEDSAPGAFVSSVEAVLSDHTEYVIVARPTVIESPGTGTATVVVPVSGAPETSAPV